MTSKTPQQLPLSHHHRKRTASSQNGSTPVADSASRPRDPIFVGNASERGIEKRKSATENWPRSSNGWRLPVTRCLDDPGVKFSRQGFQQGLAQRQQLCFPLPSPGRILHLQSPCSRLHSRSLTPFLPPFPPSDPLSVSRVACEENSSRTCCNDLLHQKLCL